MGIYNKTPVISIIVPVYNVSKYLEECLDSIIRQSFGNFECILVDDGSTDNSGAICDRYSKIDSRFKVIHQENKGLPGARYAGYKYSKGTYIGFVDGDDWIDSDMYEKLIDAMHDDMDITMISFKQECQGSPQRALRKLGKREELSAKEAIARLLTKRVFGWELVCKLYNRKLFDEGIFPIGASVGEDLITSSRLFLRANKVTYLPYDSYHYRLHPESMTNSNTITASLKFIDAVRIVLSEYKSFDAYIYNYLLYWYSYLIIQNLIDLYIDENVLFKSICGRHYLELKWSLSEIDKKWLNRKEVVLTKAVENKDFDTLLHEIKNRNKIKCCSFTRNHRVYVYGAGKMGKFLKNILLENGINIEGYIVSQKKENTKDVDGVEIYSLDDVLDKLPESYVFIGVSIMHYAEINDTLLKRGAKHIYWPPLLRYVHLGGEIEKAKDKLLLYTNYK